MLPRGDTIAAIATATGAGGVGIVRVSGAMAATILATVMRTEEAKLRDHFLDYGHAMDGDEVVDEVLYVLMRGPRSFTGEDVAEIHGHGGAANLARLLRVVVAAGCRHAEPGEFTRRAFENRRIDLTRAEAIADIVNASSERALRVAHSQLQGALGETVDGLVEEVTSLLAEVEAGIDFPEDNLSFSERNRQVEKVSDAARHCRVLGQSYGLGQRLQSGLDVVLTGPVNAGKSSLFNKLVGKDRAIVDSDAGTTRDYVEAQVVWDGIPITLVDTAGTRDANSRVEGQGIAMGKERAALADLQVSVRSVVEGFDQTSEDPREIQVLSKCDLVRESESPGIQTSALSQQGVQELKDEIVRRATGGATESAEGCVVTNERQRSRLVQASEHLVAASERIAEGAPSEVVVIELGSARQSLTEITGESSNEAMLDELFSRFCIGK